MTIEGSFVSRRNFAILAFLSRLGKKHKRGSVGVGFKQLANYFERHSNEGRVVKATITKVTNGV